MQLKFCNYIIMHIMILCNSKANNYTIKILNAITIMCFNMLRVVFLPASAYVFLFVEVSSDHNIIPFSYVTNIFHLRSLMLISRSCDLESQEFTTVDIQYCFIWPG